MPSTFVHLFAALPLPRNEQPMRYGFEFSRLLAETQSQGTLYTEERRKDLNKLFADVNLSSLRPHS